MPHGVFEGDKEKSVPSGGTEYTVQLFRRIIEIVHPDLWQHLDGTVGDRGIERLATRNDVFQRAQVEDEVEDMRRDEQRVNLLRADVLGKVLGALVTSGRSDECLPAVDHGREHLILNNSPDVGRLQH